MRALMATDRHLRDQNGGGGDGAAKIEVGSDGAQVDEHLLQISRDGDLGYRIRELAVFNPQPGGAGGIIAGDGVGGGADQLGDIKSIARFANDVGGSFRSGFEEKVPGSDARVAA